MHIVHIDQAPEFNDEPLTLHVIDLGDGEDEITAVIYKGVDVGALLEEPLVYAAYESWLRRQAEVCEGDHNDDDY